MFERKGYRWPITLGVVLIVLVIALIVGWVILSVVGAVTDDSRAGFYWAWLSIGATLLTLVLVGIVMYLTLSIKAIRLNRRQSNFLDAVTHELKSPIASLKLYLQTLHRRPMPEPERADFYRDMLDDVERLDTLVNNLLEVARLERGGRASEPEDIELSPLIATCAHNVCLRHDVDPSLIKLEIPPCIVRAPRADIEMIFRNLLDNAIKYGGDSPEVVVKAEVQNATARSDHSRVLVSVTDNGVGIPQNMRRRIFGRFVRLGQELEREKPGVGLGLYIVRSVVHRLRGRIHVRDRSDAKGSVFEIELPGRALERPADPTVSTNFAA